MFRYLNVSCLTTKLNLACNITGAKTLLPYETAVTNIKNSISSGKDKIVSPCRLKYRQASQQFGITRKVCVCFRKLVIHDLFLFFSK